MPELPWTVSTSRVRSGDPDDDEVVGESDSFKDVGNHGGGGHDFCDVLTSQVG